MALFPVETVEHPGSTASRYGNARDREDHGIRDGERGRRVLERSPAIQNAGDLGGHLQVLRGRRRLDVTITRHSRTELSKSSSPGYRPPAPWL